MAKKTAKDVEPKPEQTTAKEAGKRATKKPQEAEKKPEKKNTPDSNLTSALLIKASDMGEIEKVKLAMMLIAATGGVDKAIALIKRLA
jgi:hypothetical protein